MIDFRETLRTLTAENAFFFSAAENVSFSGASYSDAV
jgi:hypothetical protein